MKKILVILTICFISLTAFNKYHKPPLNTVSASPSSVTIDHSVTLDIDSLNILENKINKKQSSAISTLRRMEKEMSEITINLDTIKVSYTKDSNIHYIYCNGKLYNTY